MTAQKRQRLMFAILIVSVLFGLAMKPWERRRPAIAVPQSETPVVEESVVAVVPAVVAVDYIEEWPARDPFKGASQRSVASAVATIEHVSFGTPSFALQGVMTVGAELVCVIDGASRAVGASVGGWRVEKIEAQGVWVSQGGERHYVPLQ